MLKNGACIKLNLKRNNQLRLKKNLDGIILLLLKRERETSERLPVIFD